MNINLLCVNPNNNEFMQNINRTTKKKKKNHTGTQRFTWIGFWPTSTGDVEEKVSLTKERDYKGSTKTLSQNPSPKYTQKSSQSPEARD